MDRAKPVFPQLTGDKSSYSIGKLTVWNPVTWNALASVPHPSGVHGKMVVVMTVMVEVMKKMRVMVEVMKMMVMVEVM